MSPILTAYFHRWRHCLWQLMPWNLQHWIGTPQGHCEVTLYAAGRRPVSIECECGRVFYHEQRTV